VKVKSAFPFLSMRNFEYEVGDVGPVESQLKIDEVEDIRNGVAVGCGCGDDASEGSCCYSC
jgi:hypothetical protein